MQENLSFESLQLEIRKVDGVATTDSPYPQIEPKGNKKINEIN